MAPLIGSLVVGVCVAINLFAFVATGSGVYALGAVWCAFCLWTICETEVYLRRRAEVLEHFMEISRKARRDTK